MKTAKQLKIFGLILFFIFVSPILLPVMILILVVRLFNWVLALLENLLTKIFAWFTEPFDKLDTEGEQYEN